MSEMRKLGRSGLSTPRLILGGNVFGWTADRAASFAVLDAFAAAGGRMIDTADVYSSWVPGNEGGESETIIGEWLKARGLRDKMLIATKGGYAEGLAADRIAAAAERSLVRLGIDTIDLYYTHKDDQETPLEETLGALDRLVKAGKVRAIGASQIEPDRLGQALDISEAHGWARYEVLQTWYNLVERPRFEGALADVARQRGVATVSFYSLASGYLTGKYRTEADLGQSVRGGGVATYLEGNGPRVLAALDAVAAETGATPAQVALAWIAAQPGVAAPIASATSVAQVEELIGAMNLELSEAQVARLSAAST
ncbi:aldo/keto reductase [Enterovirga sp. GCM10030262]|uniref:aldo/keto reductase n=1 Tax=Enterovirga sp. GCM10030262 TaxID=3273391 RepID=UPI003610BE86